MTPKEIQAALIAIRNDVGPKAYISLDVGVDDFNPKPIEPVTGVLYPHGVAGRDGGYLNVKGASFEDVIQKLRDGWAAYRDRHRQQQTRRMALAIIRLTDELGECTDAALREEFDAGEVKSLGEDACALANTMAGKGPFAIKTMRGANAA